MSFIVPADAKSWIEVEPESDFPIQNLPFGIVEIGGTFEMATRVGATVVLLGPLARAGLITWDEERLIGDKPTMLQASREELSSLRMELFAQLSEDKPFDGLLKAQSLLPAAAVKMAVPKVTAFIDFYSGINHASNVGRMFRPDQPPLLPNYRHLPVGYNGRASSVLISETPIIRPKGQTKGADDPGPSYGPTKELDFELELGFYLGEGTELGETVPMAEAEKKMIGFVLVNDWSARDVQRWEYQPLGPFLAKSFATSISPWVVSLDALEPFRKAGPTQDPEVLPHLKQHGPEHFNIKLEVLLQTAKSTRPQSISHTNAMELYWSAAQQLAHQASNGTPLEAGDLYASGTISGTEPDSFGSMLELTWRGTKPIVIEETGEERRFLEDGDHLTIRGYCQGDGYRVGFGEVTAEIMPAH